MSTPQLERFLKDLRDSAVIAEADLQSILRQHSDGEPRSLALALVQAGLLTDWQAKFILSGRSRLRVGNYLLLERLRRDELGDCFVAWHEPLHRQVRLQILPESVTRQSPSFLAVTNLVGRLTALDHPRIEHVFDLGEEGGRLFVVCELVPGQQLDARRMATLTQGEAAGILQGLSAALATLQAHDLAHGELAAAGLLLEATGEGKLVGLCEANLRRALGSGVTLAGEEWLGLDRREWKELAERLLARQFRAAEFDGWRKLLTRSLDEPQALGELAKQIDVWRSDLKAGGGASDLGLEPDTLRQPMVETAERPETLAPERNPPPVKSSGSPKARVRRELNAPATGKVERKSSWFHLYSLVVAVLAAAGLLGYLLWRFLPAANSTQQTAAKVSASVESVQTPDLGSGQPKARERVNKILANEEAGKDGQASGMSADAIPSVGQTDEFKLGTSSGGEPQSAERTAPELPAGAAWGNAGRDVDLAEGAGVALPLGNKPEKDPFQIPGKAGGQSAPASSEQRQAEQQRAGEQAGSGTPLAGPPPSAAPLGLPAEFPATVNLGRPGEPPRTLGAIPNLKAEQLTMQLLYDPETVAKSRILFELQPDIEKSSWAVVSRKRAGDPETQAMGEFRLVDAQLQFSWAEGLDLKSNSLAFSNCLLRIEPQGGAAVVTALREPLLIEGFQLEEKTLKAEVKFDLPASPNPDSIAIVFGPFPRQGAWADALVLNENFEDRQPAVLVFRPVPNEQLFGLTVEKRWRGQVELTAAWSLQGPELPNKPGPSWLPTRQADFQQLVESTAQAYTQSVGVSDAATRASEDAPFGSKTKLRNLASEAKNNMLQLKTRNELMGVHQEQLAAIRSGGIPLRFVYRVAGEELVLAETAAAREAVLAVEAESKQPPEKEKKNDGKGMR